MQDFFKPFGEAVNSQVNALLMGFRMDCNSGLQYLFL